MEAGSDVRRGALVPEEVTEERNNERKAGNIVLLHSIIMAICCECLSHQTIVYFDQKFLMKIPGTCNMFHRKFPTEMLPQLLRE